MDLKSYSHWYDYSRARDAMFKETSTEAAPWYVVYSDDKKRARLNGIKHILSVVPDKRVKKEKIKLPKRSNKDSYKDEIDLTQVKLVKEVY